MPMRNNSLGGKNAMHVACEKHSNIEEEAGTIGKKKEANLGEHEDISKPVPSKALVRQVKPDQWLWEGIQIITERTA
jgi:hypothetical protein